MRLTPPSILLLALITLIPIGASGADELPPFDSFKIVLDRNIFNSQRTGDIRKSNKPTTQTQTITPDKITLAGVLINGAEVVAFFDGSRSEYTAAVRLGEKIANHRLVEVRTDQVRLVHNGKTLELPVGFQIQREGEEAWTVTSPPMATESSTETKSTDGSTSSSVTTTTSGGASDAIIKRLMERRKKEMGE